MPQGESSLLYAIYNIMEPHLKYVFTTFMGYSKYTTIEKLLESDCDCICEYGIINDK